MRANPSIVGVFVLLLAVVGAVAGHEPPNQLPQGPPAGGNAATNSPRSADLAERFGGAVMMIRRASPVGPLSEYRHWIDGRIRWGILPWELTPGEAAAEARLAVYAWDTWDDLERAVIHADNGSDDRCVECLDRLRRSIGEDAYAAGRMPAFPARLYWTRNP
jgi:hypothetical protein